MTVSVTKNACENCRPSKLGSGGTSSVALASPFASSVPMVFCRITVLKTSWVRANHGSFWLLSGSRMLLNCVPGEVPLIDPNNW